MSAKTIHLNLLQDGERLSSSPVRLKVILPVIAGTVLVALLGWWLFLLLQLWMFESDVRRLNGEIEAMAADDAVVCRLKDELRVKSAELGQLTGYLRGRRAWGGTLAAVAEIVPPTVSLDLIEIPPPPPQHLTPPPGIRLPPLPGPTNADERVTLRIAGRSSDESGVFAFLSAARRTSAFTNNVIVVRSPDGQESPRMIQFGQASAADESGRRAIVFDFEYRTPGRNFAP